MGAATIAITVNTLPYAAMMIPSSAAKSRSAIVVTMDEPLRRALVAELRILRWTVREASGAAEMFALLDGETAAACIIDSWLPDLEVRECVREIRAQYPQLDVLTVDGTDVGAAPAKGAFRAETLHALRQAQDHLDAPAWKNSLPTHEILRRHGAVPEKPENLDHSVQATVIKALGSMRADESPSSMVLNGPQKHVPVMATCAALSEFVGTDSRLLEVSRRIQLVAHRKTAVLVHGPTGTGKELVARALHRLSGRPQEKFIAINCAAIPEALVEAELFGHARGAFTGAMHSRIGRIEAAAGGTLFLDEIGELPLPVQSKLLRFLESGEIQRVGENEVVHMDVRVVAATHRKLGAMAAEGTFRLDLLHRLSVFLIQTPSLAGRHTDMDALIAHTLGKLGADEPAKHLSVEARRKLHSYAWPGNVRELEHTLERAWILSGDSSVIDEECVDFGEALM